jgi:putative methylase
MKLKNLEMMLQQLSGFESPQPSLEQYQTPAPLAARLLYHAHMKGDIEGKTVCDLGSGTGTLAIGASVLGAEKVISVEIDGKALTVAEENMKIFDSHVEFIIADIGDPTLRKRIGTCDTVVMNPPFGAQKKHADRPFVDLALQLAPVTYGIFNAGSIPFMESYTKSRAILDEVVSGSFPIKRTFSFHTREIQEIGVEILRLKRK